MNISKNMVPKVVAQLLAGKEVLEQNEWITGRQKQQLASASVNPVYGYCAIGALKEGNGGKMPAVARMVLDEVSTYRSVIHYNDTFAKTKSDVLRIYDKAIKFVKTLNKEKK